MQYISNVYVVKDSANSENEGKVFLYKYGKKIFDKLNEAMQPAFEDETPVNPFDFYEGANFRLKARNVEGYRNYDKSEFDSPVEFLDGDDDALEEVWNQQYSLQDFVAPEQFKSYAELEAKLNRVLGLDGRPNPSRAETVEDDLEEEVKSSPVMREAPAPKVEEDDDLSFFEKLADDD